MIGGFRRLPYTALLAAGLVLALSSPLSAVEYPFLGWSTPYSTVYLDDHAISFHGYRYDFPVSGQSTWYYFVDSDEGPAISHWVLGLCTEHTVARVNIDTNRAEIFGDEAEDDHYTLGYDSHTSTTGIKWELGFEDNEARQQSVTIQGNWAAALVSVGIKAAGDTPSGTILGPSCDPYVEEELEVAVSGLQPLTIDQPLIGQWVDSGGINTASLGDLSVSVTVTGSITYTLLVSYGIGAASDPLNPVFDGLPLSFEYPTGSGSWTEILAGPSGVTLPGLSGTASRSYPIRVNLDQLGDRKAGEVIEFELTVTVTAD